MSGALTDAVALMDGDAALPRNNGELVFAAPWEARAFAMAIALVDERGLEWDAFRHRLMAAIADDPERPYFESWSLALEALVVSLDLATTEMIGAAMPDERGVL